MSIVFVRIEIYYRKCFDHHIYRFFYTDIVLLMVLGCLNFFKDATSDRYGWGLDCVVLCLWPGGRETPKILINGFFPRFMYGYEFLNMFIFHLAKRYISSAVFGILHGNDLVYLCSSACVTIVLLLFLMYISCWIIKSPWLDFRFMTWAPI